MIELISKKKIDHLILNYFIEEGHQEAALSFAKETKIDLSNHRKQQPKQNQTNKFIKNLSNDSTNSADGFADLVEDYLHQAENTNGEASSTAAHNSYDNDGNNSREVNSKIVAGYSTINKRREIKYLILKGQITDAIQKLSEYFPTILDSNNLLHFKLLRLNLIEMIRNHKLKAKNDQESEKKFLNDILTFVRENLVNKVTNSSKLLKELEITMSLLCFNFDPSVKNIEDQKDLPDELRSLFNLSLRNQCYKVVNQAILNLDHNNIKGSRAIRFSNEVNDDNEVQDEDFTGPKYLEFDFNDLDERSLIKHESNDDSFEFESKPVDKTTNPDDDVNMLGENGEKGEEEQEEEEINYDYNLSYDKNVLSVENNVQSQDNLIQDEEFEDELQNASLESKLERIIKLWVITERNIIDARDKKKND